MSLKHRLWFLKLKDTTQPHIQQILGLHLKLLKEGSSNIEHNLIPLPSNEAQITETLGYTPPVQPQYPWTYNPSIHTHKPQEISSTSDLGPRVVPEASQYQISTNLTMIQQNFNRSSEDARLRTHMNPTINIPTNIQTTTNSSIQVIVSNKSSAIEVHIKEDKFSDAPTSTFT